MKTANEITIEAYENNPDAYTNKTPQKVNGEFKQWVDQGLAGLKKGARIIEVGVAFGRSADYIESKGFTVERTDAAKIFVSLQQKAGHKAREFNVLKDNFKPPYDLILAEAVLLHFNLSEVNNVAKKVFSALNSGGKFLFSVKEGVGERWEDEKLGGKRYFHFWQPQDISKILTQAEFKDFTIKSIVDTRGGGKPNWLLVSAERERQNES